MTLRPNTPEAMYGDIAAKGSQYARLSVTLAGQGDPFGAVHAAWASDVCVMQAVVLERVMMASPRPDQQFVQVANTVSKALALYARDPGNAVHADDAVRHARHSLRHAFDDPVLVLLEDRWAPLDHLARVPLPGPGLGRHIAFQRFQGASPNEFLASRADTAEEQMTFAGERLDDGDVEAAIAAAYHADMASFEGYLIEAALAVGDASFATVHLRWALACQQITDVASLPSDFDAASREIRDALTATVGPVDAARLTARFQPLPSLAAA